MRNMSSAPLPTQLTLLSKLPDNDMGSKVRFLGCVTSYQSAKGLLEIVHESRSQSLVVVRAKVDVNLILENVTRETLEVGAWVNVVGYIQGITREAYENNDNTSK